MPSRTFAIVVSRVYLPPGWAKLWWFADDIQYDHQHKLQKKAPRFFSGRIHAPADSFISKNEGMNEIAAFKATNCDLPPESMMSALASLSILYIWRGAISSIMWASWPISSLIRSLSSLVDFLTLVPTSSRPASCKAATTDQDLTPPVMSRTFFPLRRGL